jgi:GNAT superfamily N-acetyltransferase
MSEITEAVFEDIPQLCELLTVLFSQEADFAPDTKKQSAGLRQIIENPDIGRILVLRDGSVIIGMVNLLFTISTASGGRVAILEDMIVRPEYRNKGYGSKLLGAAADFAKSAGCLRITLLTDKANKNAQKFYKRHGFELSKMLPMRLIINQH